MQAVSELTLDGIAPMLPMIYVIRNTMETRNSKAKKAVFTSRFYKGLQNLL